MAGARERAHDFLMADFERIAAYLDRANFAAYADLLRRPVRLAILNFFAGLFRGVGIGVGFTLVATGLVLLLQQLEILNLPVIGKYIAEVVRIVQIQLNNRAV
ncbi:hypothetical protein JI721_00930 [Alicyclobacillus cycloheptanicus]|uniref:Signal transduction histidine kinase n=1 Tax=Alicyclobacillus cycloheptanicus TaxID=1457 RepID=A0ABT9XL05_9BACL|nr:DUF5665 domain-containing protein [Alicyclobacillus cycloheptanicus]MDQ0190989.1 hypothetical protein [Alicyclobacillus cycloheptanicus]WDM01484.1 hypothetical protein JI721_00930 [Alicyclobacillus cycloheptanicus]